MNFFSIADQLSDRIKRNGDRLLKGHSFQFGRPEELRLPQDDLGLTNKDSRFAINDQGQVVDKATRLKEFDEGSEPVVLLRGLGLSTEEWAKYDYWVNEWGYDIYLPILLKFPGITDFSRCALSNFRFEGSKPVPDIALNLEYPQDLSIIYFENLKTYQNFRKSKELAAFEKTLAAALPFKLNYKWDVSFRLARRWSR